ncbi:TPA: hypothetical protein RU600_001881 [Salmonella enterica]|nr:hypothetical protein [Salmonella enterica]HEA0390768.1 hypothetical protein [Salmonella enterica]
MSGITTYTPSLMLTGTSATLLLTPALPYGRNFSILRGNTTASLRFGMTQEMIHADAIAMGTIEVRPPPETNVPAAAIRMVGPPAEYVPGLIGGSTPSYAPLAGPCSLTESHVNSLAPGRHTGSLSCEITDVLFGTLPAAGGYYLLSP